jgi:hypothetical protein
MREDLEMRNLLSKTFLVTSVAAGALYAGALQAQDAKLAQTNLVSDIPGLATITDAKLHNPWGVSHSPTSPFWVSNQGTNSATLYAVTDETTVIRCPSTRQPASSRSRPSGADPLKDPLAKSTMPTPLPSRSGMAETANRRTSYSPI